MQPKVQRNNVVMVIVKRHNKSVVYAAAAGDVRVGVIHDRWG